MNLRLSFHATCIGLACALSHLAKNVDHVLGDSLPADIQHSTEGDAIVAARNQLAVKRLDAPNSLSKAEQPQTTVRGRNGQNSSPLKQPAPHDEALEAGEVLRSFESSRILEASRRQKKQDAQRDDDVSLVGHSKVFNNVFFFAALVFVAFSAFIGNRLNGERGWMFGMLGSSYLLLILGIFATFFSADVLLKVDIRSLPATNVRLTPDDEPISESMTSIVKELASAGGWLGAALVVTYAMIIPVTKLMLLLLGEKLRTSNITANVEMARTCIGFVQVISKWACLDLLVYMLLFYLLRVVGSEPMLTVARLDIGFTCFGLFCTFSTISSLAIKLPEAPRRIGVQSRPWLQLNSRWSLAFLVLLLECSFGFLFVVGSTTPCMALRLKAAMLVQPNGPLSSSAKLLLDMSFGDEFNADTSLLDCATGYAGYVRDGEMSTFLGLVTLVVFVVFCTVLDMLMLLFAVLYGSSDGPVIASISKFLKHMSMLDVFAMGVVVVCLAAGTPFKDNGLEISMQKGLWMLIGAEVVHYVAHYVVLSNARLLHEEESSDKHALLVSK